jgi:hypothetical protein
MGILQKNRLPFSLIIPKKMTKLADIKGFADEKIIPAVAKIAFAVAEIIPAVAKIAPAVAEIIPAVAKIVFSVAEIIPAVAEMAPAVAKIVFAVATEVPAVANITPAVATGLDITPKDTLNSTSNLHNNSQHNTRNPIQLYTLIL